MLKLIFDKDDSFFLEKKLASSRGAPQENDAKFRFVIHPQVIGQFYDNCQIAKCQTVAHWRQSTSKLYWVLYGLFLLNYI